MLRADTALMKSIPFANGGEPKSCLRVSWRDEEIAKA